MIQEAIWTPRGKLKSLKYCLHAAYSTTTVFIHYNMKWRKMGWSGSWWDQTEQQKHTWEWDERASSGRKARGETPLLKATLTEGTGLGKNNNLELTRNLSPCLLVSFHGTRKCWERKETSDLPGAGALCRTDIPDKISPLVQQWHMVMGSTNYFLLYYYGICSIERISYRLRMNYLIHSVVAVYFSHVKIDYVSSN